MAVLYFLSLISAAVIVFADTIILLPETSMNIMNWSVGFFALLYSIAFLLGNASGIFSEKYAGKLWDKDIEMNPYVKLWRYLSLGGILIVLFCLFNTVRGIVAYIISTVQFVAMGGGAASPYIYIQLALIIASILFYIWGIASAKGTLMFLARRNATLMKLSEMPIFDDIDKMYDSIEAIGIKDDRIIISRKDGEEELIYNSYSLENIYAFGRDGHPDKHKNDKIELIALYFEARYKDL